MTPAEKIKKFLIKRGVTPQSKIKVKQKSSDISNAAKQKELLLLMAYDLGYID